MDRAQTLTFTKMNRAPETLGELKKEILRQLDTSEVVTITLHEGDDIHELLESISFGIEGIKYQNLHDRPSLRKYTYSTSN